MTKTNEIVGLTKQLIRFKTTSDNYLELKKCIRFIEKYFSGCNVIIKKYESNKKPSLIVLFKKTKGAELFLVGHIDVVPASNELFKPIVKVGKMYGRGALDNKVNVAIIMSLMRFYSKQRQRPNIGLMITSDEEVGGKNGVGYLLRKQKYAADFSLVLDAGDNYEIVTQEKGALHVKISTKGRDAHGSRPWKGENAIDKLIDFYLKLKKSFPKTTKQNRWKQTVNLGMIKGGSAVNKVPDYAEMWLDMRFTNEKEKREIIKEIKRTRGIKFEIITDANVLNTNKNNLYVRALKESIEKIIKKKTRFSKEHGASDARFFAYKKIPTALIVPLGHNIHAKEEYVEINSISKVYDILKNFIDNNIGKI